MNPYPQAKKCLYNGRWFKSNLEGKVAEALDRLGIGWQYEPVVVRGPQFAGGQYTPDFFLPHQNAYVEVAGRWDDRHAANAAAFFRTANCAATDDFDRRAKPLLLMVDGSGAPHGVNERGVDDGRRMFVNECRACGAHSLMAYVGPYGCPACGAWDGDRYVRPIGENLLDAAGVKRYGGR